MPSRARKPFGKRMQRQEPSLMPAPSRSSFGTVTVEASIWTYAALDERVDIALGVGFPHRQTCWRRACFIRFASATIVFTRFLQNGGATILVAISIAASEDTCATDAGWRVRAPSRFLPTFEG